MKQPDYQLPYATTLEVRDRCLCFRTQRAARTLARRFDAALKPVGLSNGQYSLLMSLNRPEPPRMTDVADFLAMDRTTLTAALKVLQRRGLVQTAPDHKDRRNRRVSLTPDGHALLKEAVSIWRAEHDALDRELDMDPAALRAMMEGMT
ncbi:MarR family winged helix-turn-helix transcriptional regulator [Sagittula stellata]|uniref:Transcriptional regulator, MarR family protein n=1 Tax=Sagittula stellata (strain ATCC 700073 / DSM 11524 / E-37) TaxID=388399 RepID=A3K3E6_SAGS3|nr:MarR family transcriptional regulator [Sagittula stellata]EBA08060.1 transcriptional regulator, MarR family protein [Sagittula stellata E-37]